MALIDTVPIQNQVEAYLESNIKQEIYSLLDCYTQQNLNWVEKLISDILCKKSSFIAVGAAHFPGKNGLIELLRNKGYTITPVIE